MPMAALLCATCCVGLLGAGAAAEWPKRGGDVDIFSLPPISLGKRPLGSHHQQPIDYEYYKALMQAHWKRGHKRKSYWNDIQPASPGEGDYDNDPRAFFSPESAGEGRSAWWDVVGRRERLAQQQQPASSGGTSEVAAKRGGGGVSEGKRFSRPPLSMMRSKGFKHA